MGVFTTRTLLSSVGVSQSKVTPGAIAINWILKDGAGRVGKMLFARQGKKFDYDLKQLRFSSDLLLEIGAGIELTTAAFPQFFLPMACVANVVKVCPHQALAIPFWDYSISKVLTNCIFFLFRTIFRTSLLLHQPQRALQSIRPMQEEKTLVMSLLKANLSGTLQICWVLV
jgi:hypothetical protein